MYASIRFIKTSLISAILGLSTYSLNAQATLTSYTANGVDLVYSSVSDVTWTKDANLLGSLFASQGYNTVVNNILAVNPTISNTPNYFDGYSGTYTLRRNDFSSNGSVTWFGALAFINYLNNINYAGNNQWRLPSFVTFESGWNTPSNGNIKGNELTELFYQELNSKGAVDADGNYLPDHGILDLENKFDNEQKKLYWSSTELLTDYQRAWGLNMQDGLQLDVTKGDLFGVNYQVWAITNGQISAVPAPAAAWLFASGLPIIAVAKRRRRKCA